VISNIGTFWPIWQLRLPAIAAINRSHHYCLDYPRELLQIGMDRLIYTATFHKTDDLRHLYGVRETSQMLVMTATMTLKKTGR
jgi:hypothetical protein